MFSYCQCKHEDEKKGKSPWKKENLNIMNDSGEFNKNSNSKFYPNKIEVSYQQVWIWNTIHRVDWLQLFSVGT